MCSCRTRSWTKRASCSSWTSTRKHRRVLSFGMSHPIVVHPFDIPIRLGSFSFSLSGFGIAVLLAFVIAQIVSERELARRGHDHEARHVGDVLLAALVGTIVGGKLYYVGVITHN